MKIYDLRPEDLLNYLRELIDKPSLSFIQIGVNDGIRHDIANGFLKETDIGYFIEPIEETFEIMKINKKNFRYAKFIKKAILPEVLKNNNIINLLSQDNNNEGASFGKFNKDRIVSQKVVDTITIKNFISEENIENLDFLFCDAESIDHLIILDLVNEITPTVLFFETCWWCTEDADLELSDGSKVKIPSRAFVKEILNQKGYEVIDYWEHDKFGREDMIAIKKVILPS